MKYKYRLSLFGCLMAVSFYMTAAQAALNLSNRTLHRNPEKVCVGHCDHNINCSKEDKQGYYTWCQKNCTDKSIPHYREYLAAVDRCDHGSLNKKYRGRIIAKNNKLDGFTVEITNAQHNNVNHIGEMIFLSTKKNNETLAFKIGDVIEFNQLNTFSSDADKNLHHQVSDPPFKIN